MPINDVFIKVGLRPFDKLRAGSAQSDKVNVISYCFFRIKLCLELMENGLLI